MDPADFQMKAALKLKTYVKARSFLSLLLVAFILAAIPITTVVVQNTRDLRSKANTTATPTAISFAAATPCIGGNPTVVRFNWTRDQTGFFYELYWDGSGGSISTNSDVSEITVGDNETGFSPGTINWHVRAFNPTTEESGPYYDSLVTIPSSCTPVPPISQSPTPSSTLTPTPTQGATITPSPTSSSARFSCGPTTALTNPVEVVVNQSKTISIDATGTGPGKYAPALRFTSDLDPNDGKFEDRKAITATNDPLYLDPPTNKVFFKVANPSQARLNLTGSFTRVDFVFSAQTGAKIGNYQLSGLTLVYEPDNSVLASQNCVGALTIKVTNPGGGTPTPTPINTTCASSPTSKAVTVSKGGLAKLTFTVTGGPPPSTLSWAPAVRFVSSERSGTGDVNGDGVPDGYKAVDSGLNLGSGLTIKTNYPRFSSLPTAGLPLEFSFDATSYTPTASGNYTLDNLLILDEGNNSVIKLCSAAVTITVTVPTTPTPTSTPTPTPTATSCSFSPGSNVIPVTGGTAKAFSVVGKNLQAGTYEVGYVFQPEGTGPITNNLFSDLPIKGKLVLNDPKLTLTITNYSYQASAGGTNSFNFTINSTSSVPQGSYTLNNLYLAKDGDKNLAKVTPCTGSSGGGLVIEATPITVTIQGHHKKADGVTDLNEAKQLVTITGGPTPLTSPNSYFLFEELKPNINYTVKAKILPGFTIEKKVCFEIDCPTSTLPYEKGEEQLINLTVAGKYVDIYFKYTPVGSTPTPTPTSQPDIAYCNFLGDGYSFDITQGEIVTRTVPKEILNGRGGPWAPGVRFVNPVDSNTGERRQAVGENGEAVLLGNGLILTATPARFSFPYSEELVYTFRAAPQAEPNDYQLSNLLLVHEPTNDLDKDANCTGTLTINVKAKPTPTPTSGGGGGPPRPTSTPTPTPTPTPEVTGVTIQGHHVDDKGTDLTIYHPAYSRTRVGILPHLDIPGGGEIPFTYSTDRPYYRFTNISEGIYTVEADVPSGFSVSYLYGTFPPGQGCSVDQSSAPTKGNTLAFTLPSDGWCADVYFKYTPTSSGGTSTPTPTVSQVEKPTGLAVTDSKCNDARTSASITFNWYHPTASSFKIGWRTKSESRITNFFTPTNPPPSPVFDPGSFTPNGFWEITYPGFSPGVELAEWAVVAVEAGKPSDPASSGGTVSARDCRLGGTPTPTPTPTLTTTPIPNPTTPPSSEVKPPEALSADTSLDCAGPMSARVKFRWKYPTATSGVTFRIAWGKDGFGEWEYVTPTKLTLEKAALLVPTGYYNTTFEGFNTYGQPIPEWVVVAIKDGKESFATHAYNFTPKDCSKQIGKPRNLTTDSDCTREKKFYVSFKWDAPDGAPANLDYELRWTGLKVNINGVDTDNVSTVGANTATFYFEPSLNRLEETITWRVRGFLQSDVNHPGEAEASTVKIRKCLGDIGGAIPTPGLPTPTDSPGQRKPYLLDTTATDCVGVNNASVTFRWHQEVGTAERFEIGWGESLDTIEVFSPDGIVTETRFSSPSGDYHLTYPGFNTEGRAIPVWAVKAITGEKFAIGKGEAFIPKDCSQNSPVRPQVYECCGAAVTRSVNAKTLETIESLNTFMATTPQEVNAEFTLTTNPITWLNVSNYMNPIVLVRSSNRREQVRLDKATYDRLATHVNQGYSVKDILTFYQSLESGGDFNTRGLRYLDAKFFQGGIEAYILCAKGDPLTAQNCTKPEALNDSPLFVKKIKSVDDLARESISIGDLVSINYLYDNLKASAQIEEDIIDRLANSTLYGRELSGILLDLRFHDESSREFLGSEIPQLASLYFRFADRISDLAPMTAAEVYTLIADHLPSNYSNSARNRAATLRQTPSVKDMLFSKEFLIAFASLDIVIPYGKPFKLLKVGAVSTKVAKGSVAARQALARRLARDALVANEEEGLRYVDDVIKLEEGVLADGGKQDLGGIIKRVAGGVSSRSTDDIARAQSFEELFNTLNDLKQVNSSSGRTYTANEIRVKIERLIDDRISNDFSLTSFTRDFGLRSKVKELLDKSLPREIDGLEAQIVASDQFFITERSFSARLVGYVKENGEIVFDNCKNGSPERCLRFSMELHNLNSVDFISAVNGLEGVATDPQVLEYGLQRAKQHNLLTVERFIENSGKKPVLPADMLTPEKFVSDRVIASSIVKISLKPAVRKDVAGEIYVADGFTGFGNIFRDGERKVYRVFWQGGSGSYKVVVKEDDPALIVLAQSIRDIRDPFERVRVLSEKINDIPYAGQVGGDPKAFIAKFKGQEVPVGEFITDGAICFEKSIMMKAALDLAALSVSNQPPSPIRIVTGSHSVFEGGSKDPVIGCSRSNHAWLEFQVLVVKDGVKSFKLFHVDPTQNEYVLPRLTSEVYGTDIYRVPKWIEH